MIVLGEKTFYTVAETAKKIDIHPVTIRKWIQEKRVLACKLGGRWYVDEDILKKLLTVDESQTGQEG